MHISGKTSSDKLVPVKVDDEGNIITALAGLQSGAMQRAPIPFGASGSIARAWSNTNLAAGTNNVDDSAVPAGEYWVITQLGMQYVGAVATFLGLQIVSSSTSLVFQIDPPVNTRFYDRQGWWVLFPGDLLRVRVIGAALNDDAFGSAVGFRVDIDQ